MRDLPKGDIPILILAVLSGGPCHGYAIARQIERESGNLLRLRDGTLYPALRVLEQDEQVTCHWEHGETGPARKVYAITAAGRAELARRAALWRHYADSVSRVLGGRPHGEPA